MHLTRLSVFVYGTLKPGGRYWPEFCEGKVGEPVPAKIKGELYDLHVGYPGLWIGGTGSVRATLNREDAEDPMRTRRSSSLPRDKWVQGYVLTFQSEEDFFRLDYLEGYEPNRPYSENEYIRLKVPCFSPEGEALGEVWTYEMTAATMERHKGTLIPKGEWEVRHK